MCAFIVNKWPDGFPEWFIINITTIGVLLKIWLNSFFSQMNTFIPLDFISFPIFFSFVLIKPSTMASLPSVSLIKLIWHFWAWKQQGTVPWNSSHVLFLLKCSITWRDQQEVSTGWICQLPSSVAIICQLSCLIGSIFLTFSKTHFS